MIPFARAFQRAGHDVAVATSAEMAAVVIGAGLIWYPAGLHPTEAVEMFDGESADYGESVLLAGVAEKMNGGGVQAVGYFETAGLLQI